MAPKKKKTTKLMTDLWENELIERATIAVDAYEKYLLDKVNYTELAKIMQELRNALPVSDDKKKINKNENL